ncbi:hypothetical protein [Nocardia sp. NPDC049149]|uniref:hypothetical protein n=1 Tax=Nocardia sp. NPDC049149 TaxID=3364315 RepID=UPI003723C213
MAEQSTDLKAIMRRDERHRKMLNDPDLTGDLLLFALGLDEVIATRQAQGRKTSGKSWMTAITRLVSGDEGYRRYWAKHVVERDVPRYEPSKSRGRGCIAPMIRREGLCGQPGSTHVLDLDPMTGEGAEGYLCARHRGLEAKYLALKRQWHANGEPSPSANTGGVLRRYFNADWDGIYRWASPWREPLEGGREATPPRPTLRLIQGEGEVSS